MAQRPMTDEQRSDRPKDRLLPLVSFPRISRHFLSFSHSTPLRVFMRWLPAIIGNWRFESDSTKMNAPSRD